MRTNDGAGSQLTAATEQSASTAKISTGKWTHSHKADAIILNDATATAKGIAGTAGKKAVALDDLKNTAAGATSITAVVVLNPLADGSSTTTQASTTTTTTKPGGPPPGSGAPTSPPALICGNHSILDGPATAPAGAVSVPAGDNSSLNPAPNKTYWFAPGVHTLGTGQYGQIIPETTTLHRCTGRGASTARARTTTRSPSTPRRHDLVPDHPQLHVAAPDEGVVNHDSGDGWTIANNTHRRQRRRRR